MTKQLTAAAVLSALVSLAHAGTTYSLQALPNLGNVSGTRSYANAMAHKSGVVVGQSITANDSQIVAVRWVNGQVVPLPVVGLGTNTASGVNEKGQTVGQVNIQPSSNSVPIRWDADGSYVLLTPLEAPYSSVVAAIGNDGKSYGAGLRSGAVAYQPVMWAKNKPTVLPLPAGAIGGGVSSVSLKSTVLGGYYAHADGAAAALIWTAGAPTPITVPANAWQSQIFAVNDAGQAAGVMYTDEGNTRPIAVSAGVATELPVLPGGNYAWGVGINAKGLIVGGSSCQCPGGTHGVLWKQGRVIDLNSLLDGQARASGWTITWASSVDDSGRIMGLAESNSVVQPVVLTPVPTL